MLYGKVFTSSETSGKIEFSTRFATYYSVYCLNLCPIEIEYKPQMQATCIIIIS